ncbi:MAG: hypothetical protein HY961_17440 [Ignavibacteriae bacterium]|nr:hypothetical protein [Ignavibacteriota bacterium]
MKRDSEYQNIQLLMLLVVLAMLSRLCSVEAKAQTDTVNVPGYFQSGGMEGTLNTAVTAAINDSTISNKVFKLKQFEWYVLNASITIPQGKHLTIVADEPGTTQESAPPQILWSAAGGITTLYNFNCFGDITLKNVWLLYATTAGTQTSTSLRIQESLDSIHGQHATFEGVLFDYSVRGTDGSGAVSVTSKHFRGKFTNCYFRNCADSRFENYGRAISFPFQSTGWHIDSLTFDNCTFANMGYVQNQEGGEYADFVRYNHCTFVNTMMFTLQSGWWHWLSISNSVFVNAHMMGDFPAQRLPGEQPYGGTISIDSVARFGFPVPFTDVNRHILFTHSSYEIQDWLRDYMAHGDLCFPDSAYRPHPQPMMNARALSFFDAVVNGQKVFPFMNRAQLHDYVDPGFVFAPTNRTGIKRFLYYKWCGGGR